MLILITVQVHGKGNHFQLPRVLLHYQSHCECFKRLTGNEFYPDGCVLCIIGPFRLHKPSSVNLRNPLKTILQQSQDKNVLLWKPIFWNPHGSFFKRPFHLNIVIPILFNAIVVVRSLHSIFKLLFFAKRVQWQDILLPIRRKNFNVPMDSFLLRLYTVFIRSWAPLANKTPIIWSCP